MDHEFILFDRLEVIRKTVEEYGEENFYISFSGGKDSTVVHHLVDMAKPGNKIPRVFANTGIEYSEIVKFVKKMAESDDRFVLIEPRVPIKQTLEEKGYPFKSKQYSQCYQYYERHKEEFTEIRKQVNESPELLENYEFIHNLPNGIKWIVKEYYGKRERERTVYQYARCP